MPIITLTHVSEVMDEGEILESGVIKEGWTLAADARIKDVNNSLGVGPVVYTGKPKLATGVISKDGQARDAMFLFFKESEVIKALVMNRDPTDITDTVTDYLTNYGGNKSTMLAAAPTIS